jgi:hypothetical protein
LKPEWWGSPLAQEEKYQGRKKPVTRDDDDPGWCAVVGLVLVLTELRPHFLEPLIHSSYVFTVLRGHCH